MGAVMGAADGTRARRRVTLLSAVVVGLVSSLLTAGPARAAESDLSVSLAVAPAVAPVGQTVTVTVVVANSGGPVGPVDVSLYTDLPVRSATAAGGSCTAVLGSPTCSFPGVGDGATASVVAVLELARAGTHPLEAAAELAGTKRSPSRWGTCTIGYRVNQRNMPPHGMADLREAMRRVTQVNGTRFRYLGRTRLVPYAGDSRAGVDKITVAWAGSAATRGLLAPGIAGFGGTSHLGRRIRTGYLVLNTAYSSRAPEGFGEGMPHGLVLMHELGHVIGLDHTADRHQIMNPGRPLPASVWGAADLRGLRALGRASGCR